MELSSLARSLNILADLLPQRGVTSVKIADGA